jgi:hypothetical protein
MTVETYFLTEDLLAVLRFQLGNPGRKDGPEIPYAGLRVWGLFLRLHEQRGIGMGPCPVSYADMVAFARITGEAIRPWEAEIIRALDREYLTTINDRQEAPAEVSSRPMSPALFDAVFSG